LVSNPLCVYTQCGFEMSTPEHQWVLESPRERMLSLSRPTRHQTVLKRSHVVFRCWCSENAAAFRRGQMDACRHKLYNKMGLASLMWLIFQIPFQITL
jgi:hypothetical protein